jgi:hypothetical protein
MSITDNNEAQALFRKLFTGKEKNVEKIMLQLLMIKI